MTVLAELETAEIVMILDAIDKMDDPSPATVALAARLSDLLLDS